METRQSHGHIKELTALPALSGLFLSIFLLYIAGHAAQSTWTFYTIEKFHWNVQWVGYSLAFVGLMIALVQGGLIRIIIFKIGQKNSVYVGLFLYIVGFVLFAFATKSWMMFAFMIPYGLGGIAGPALQGIMSSQVPANEQGEITRRPDQYDERDLYNRAFAHDQSFCTLHS